VIGGHPLCGGPSCHQVPGPGPGTTALKEAKTDRRLYAVPELEPEPERPGDDHDDPELYELVRDYLHGRLTPTVVNLSPLPPVRARVPAPDGQLVLVTEAMHVVAADVRLLLGLRLAVSEDRPLPYSAQFCAERCGLRDKREASRVLRRLVRLGVVKVAGTLKPRGKPDGTKLYEPPDWSARTLETPSRGGLSIGDHR
jgi:hypothetical protein